uniref:UvrD-helicase domain-containing protein n=1 Tax=Pedobacter schmidteae TaxID=2201271 RepID=UPI000EB250D2|nr:UvrD-helicase domain-containing protein [Pedobacter schmidteae]
MPSSRNKLLISVAGSGKTTHIVNQALKVRDTNVLITTYTEANEEEIRRKFLEINRFIPANITIQTWFSFLIQHGVKPYQGSIYSDEINGMLLVNEASGINFVTKSGVKIPYKESSEFKKHYFTKSGKLYSDKLAKFVIRCNEKSGGNLIDRLARLYPHIFIDEVQDLAGNDLEVLKLFFNSATSVTMVGDPRQVTYLTHHEKLHSGYKNGKIKEFVLEKCKNLCAIDETTLKYSHRNNAEICIFSSNLYPALSKSEPCICSNCRSSSVTHTGVFLISEEDTELYKKKYSPTILRYKLAVNPEWNYGNCKGLGFDRVLIYPTASIISYLKNGILTKKVKGKDVPAFDIAKFYVAITRARYSVGIICSNDEILNIKGLRKWMPD